MCMCELARSFGSGQTRLSSHCVLINEIMKFVQYFHHHLCGSRPFVLLLLPAELTLPAHTAIKAPFRWIYNIYPLFVCLFIHLLGPHTYARTHTNGAHVDPYTNLIRKLIMCSFFGVNPKFLSEFSIVSVCVCLF